MKPSWNGSSSQLCSIFAKTSSKSAKRRRIQSKIIFLFNRPIRTTVYFKLASKPFQIWIKTGFDNKSTVLSCILLIVIDCIWKNQWRKKQARLWPRFFLFLKWFYKVYTPFLNLRKLTKPVSLELTKQCELNIKTVWGKVFKIKEVWLKVKNVY